MARYRDDIRAMLRIAIPLAVAELGWMAMSVVDNIMVGRLPDSTLAIGATSVGSALFYSFAIFGIGLMAGLDTLVSHAYGMGDWPEARRSLASGLVLAAAAALPLAGGVLAGSPILRAIGVQPEILEQAVEFNSVLVWSLPLLLLYSVFRRYLQGLHCVRPVTIALVTSNIINLLGNWVLIYGHWGAPAMGIRGSALSTVIARIYLVAALLLSVWMRDPAALAGMRPDFSHVYRLLRLGMPAAMTIGFEIGVFNAATAIAGKLDAVSLASHTIALNAAAVAYMVPLGIGSAAAVTVGRALGAKDWSGAIRAGWTALGIGMAFEICSALVFILLPEAITRMYTDDRNVAAFAARLFVVAAVFQIFDGLQTIASGALRGLGNTRSPMICNLIAYWAVGLPVGCWLCFRLGWGVIGIWDGLCLALIGTGASLLAVWHRSTKTQAEYLT